MPFEKLKLSCRKRIRTLYNALVDLKGTGLQPTAHCQTLAEIRQRSQKRTPINEHLETLFLESLPLKPQLILELGVARGESTFVFERVARLCGATLVSVDINDCSSASTYDKWIFVQQDDLVFANQFPAWCEAGSFPPAIDLLFIDTSHLYEHTRQEIAAFFPLLAPHAKVIFHDTNMGHFMFRKDGTLELGWDNQRGVIRALEDFFHKKFNEKKEFADFIPPWLIRHQPHCGGLTILEKLPFLPQS